MYDDNNDNGEKREDLMQKENVIEQKKIWKRNRVCASIDVNADVSKAIRSIRRRTRASDLPIKLLLLLIIMKYHFCNNIMI